MPKVPAKQFIAKRKKRLTVKNDRHVEWQSSFSATKQSLSQPQSKKYAPYSRRLTLWQRVRVASSKRKAINFTQHKRGCKGVPYKGFLEHYKRLTKISLVFSFLLRKHTTLLEKYSVLHFLLFPRFSSITIYTKHLTIFGVGFTS